MIGGPPCQGFSHAGPVNKDPKDPRNSLFREFVRFAKVLEPLVIPFKDTLDEALAALGERLAELLASDARWANWSGAVDEGTLVEWRTSDGVWLESGFREAGLRWSVGPWWHEKEEWTP